MASKSKEIRPVIPLTANSKTSGDPPDLWYWVNVYKMSNAIFAAEELGIFDNFEKEAWEIPSLAKELNLQLKKLETIVLLLQKVGILESADQQSFQLTAKSKRQLPLLRLEQFFAENYILPANIVKGLQGNYTPPDLEELMMLPGFRARYYRAMKVTTISIAPFIVRFCRKFHEKKILDIGGGDGSLLKQLRTFFSGKACYTVYDKFAKEEEQQSKKESNIQFVQGVIEELPRLTRLIEQHNILILSNLLHLLPSSIFIPLLEVIFTQMKSGSGLIIYDQFLIEGKAAAADWMQVDWILGGGDFSYTGKAFEKILREIGFSEITTKIADYFPGILFFIEK